MAHLSLHLLGPFQATLDGVPIVGFESNKVRALLAYLSVEAHRRTGGHSRQTLAGLLWPDKPERNALASLRNALSNLRTAIGDRDATPPYLRISRETIQFNLASDHWLDVAAFEELAQTAADAPDYPRLQEAAALYRGDLLEGFFVRDSLEFEEWVLLARERIHGQALEVLGTLAAYHERRGAYGEAIAYARRQVALEPWQENAHRQVMRCLALSGERAAALVQYDACRQVLAQELGIEPGTATTALYERIREGEALLPSLSSSSPGNLPAQTTCFVGRERELAELTGLLTDRSVRVVTVVGAGGMGKTRLALQVAAALFARYPAGAWLAELATVVEDEAVPRAVAAALGVREQANLSLPETIAVSLQTRELLLVLDNCEHVVEGAAGLVSLLVGRCPQLTVLATSREPLRVPGEHLHEVPPLTLPAPDAALDVLLDADAVQLFRERATAVRRGYTLDGERAVLAARICRRLDGMPLAIELAAARLRALSLAEVAQRLDDRFRLLTGGRRTVLPRQRTLRNTVDWSYELLSKAERLTFDRLSIFPGSFDLAAAQAVCARDGTTAETVLDLLAGLVDRSLVMARVTAEGTTRYRLLETLRQYGEERLTERGERDHVAARHAHYYVALAEAVEPDLESWGEEMLPALKHLDAEADNLAAAMRWSLANGQPELAMRLGGAARWWVFWRGGASHCRQYLEWLENALASSGRAGQRYRVKALGTISMCAWRLKHLDKWLEAWEDELVLARKTEDPELIARTLCGAALSHWGSSQPKRARARLQEGLRIARDCRYPAVAKWALFHLAQFEPLKEQYIVLDELLSRAPHGAIDYYLAPELGKILAGLGDLDGAEAQLRFSAEGYSAWGMVLEQVRTWDRWAQVAAMRGDYAQAMRLLEQYRDQCRRSGLISMLAWTKERIGVLAWQCGDYEVAARHYAECITLAREHAIVGEEAWYLVDLARVACERGEYERAETFCAEALGILYHADRELKQFYLPSTLARIALCRGQAAHAVELYRESLGHRPDYGRPSDVEALEALSWALAADGQHELGARLLACTARERAEMGLVCYPVDRPYQERALVAVRTGLGAAAFDVAWAQGEALSLEAAIAAAMGTTRE